MVFCPRLLPRARDGGCVGIWRKRRELVASPQHSPQHSPPGARTAALGKHFLLAGRYEEGTEIPVYLMIYYSPRLFSSFFLSFFFSFSFTLFFPPFYFFFWSFDFSIFFCDFITSITLLSRSKVCGTVKNRLSLQTDINW